MSTSSEEVLLTTNHVKHKKTEGALYLMSERMAWMPRAKDTFTISISYADVRVQKVSPDNKDKIQLQVVLHDDSSATFQFAHSGGRTQQQADREVVKELLQQLLPKFRKKISGELEHKNRLLKEDAHLFQLYKDLVVSGVLTPEEFWASHTAQKASTSQIKSSNQELGVSAAFLADIKPISDGCNGLRYNLTADLIQSIFKTFPQVQKKHAEHVPHKLSEAEFWTKFFQSHYFHRDRINMGPKELFTDCAKEDDQALEKQLSKSAEDPLVDVLNSSDSTIDEGYGVSHERPGGSGNSANAILVHRFNQHSSLVLEACTKPKASENGETVTQNGYSSTHPPPAKKSRLADKIVLTELKDEEEESATSSTAGLTLNRVDRYLQGPTPTQATQYTPTQELLQATNNTAHLLHAWTPCLTQVLHGSVATSLLGELTPGGILMQSHSQSHYKNTGGEKEIQQLYSALLELLRHFWSCFPVNSKFLEEKVVRVHGSLERFQQAHLSRLKEPQNSHHPHTQVLHHLNTLLQSAYTKFENWKTRRLAKKS